MSCRIALNRAVPDYRIVVIVVDSTTIVPGSVIGKSTVGNGGVFAIYIDSATPSCRVVVEQAIENPRVVVIDKDCSSIARGIRSIIPELAVFNGYPFLIYRYGSAIARVGPSIVIALKGKALDFAFVSADPYAIHANSSALFAI